MLPSNYAGHSNVSAIATIVVLCAGAVALVCWYANVVIQKVRSSLNRSNADLASARSEIAMARTELESLKKAKLDLEARTTHAENELQRIKSAWADAMAALRSDSALLPSAVRWATKIQALVDEAAVKALAAPPHPAPTAAAQVRAAKADARDWKQQAEILRNRIDLYEAQAPWLADFADFTVDEILEGLREDEATTRGFIAGTDPVKIFLSPQEWNRLSDGERNQVALDRYWSRRMKSAWTAGIQYERYIGYLYEKEGWSVEYRGATKGKSDMGIDIVCKKGNDVLAVQCKRLSPNKGLPVRENVVAQVFGASRFYALTESLPENRVTTMIVTSYQLSDDARRFATKLGVTIREMVQLEPYPCIKCNIARSGEKIYHLPFDQQYDVTQVGNVKGEFYASSVKEAESAGFRRAFRWHGR